MAKRIVIALGGNALGKNLEEQMQAVKTTASAIADLIEDGHEVVIAHGNGPQVGMIQNAFAAYHKQQAKSDIMPLSMCVAMSQGYIGYDLQNMIGEELDRRGLGIHCATVLTQVAVDPADPAFQHPTKPIGAFMTEEEAKKLAAEKGIDVAEDAGRGWRQVVASPRPKEIVEIATVKALMNAKHAVIAAGGGGIPVVWEDKYHLKGVPAVIDKDFGSELLAELLRIFNNSALNDIQDDIIGRIYEYFLNKFAPAVASDDGVFFTPKSLVRMIVNIVEPKRGIVLEIKVAC